MRLLPLVLAAGSLLAAPFAIAVQDSPADAAIEDVEIAPDDAATDPSGWLPARLQRVLVPDPQGPAAPGPPTRPRSEASLLPRAEWDPLTVIGRSGHGAIYDPVRRRMVVVLGRGRSGFLNNTQALGLGSTPAWSSWVLPHPRGLERQNASAVCDPGGDRVVVFGGHIVTPVDGPPGFWCTMLNDVWALGLSGTPGWTRLQVTGPAPAPRELHAAIYDRARHRMLVFGGIEVRTSSYSCWPSRAYADLWELSLEGTPAWHEIAASGAVPDSGLDGVGIHDPQRDRMLFVAAGKVWALSLASNAWTRLDISGTPPSGLCRAVYDPSRDRLLVQAGTVTYAVALAAASPAWERLAVTGTVDDPGTGYTLVWDPEGDRMLLHGGGLPECPGEKVWSLSFAGGLRWTLLQGLLPQPLSWHRMVFDPVRDRLLSVGGQERGGLLEFRPGATGLWTPVATTGPAPGSMVGHDVLYDAKRDRLIVLGGVIATGPVIVPGYWVLDLATMRWSYVEDCFPGQPRFFSAVILDPVRDRLVLYGGASEDENLGDVWELPLEGGDCWQPLDVANAGPGARVAARAAYDPVRDRMVVWGGAGAGGDFGDVWALPLAGAPAWQRIGGAGPDDPGGSFVYDPVRDQFLVSFGDRSYTALWSFKDGYWMWLDFWGESIPPPRKWHDAVYDPIRDALVLSGGYPRAYCPDQCRGALRDVWAYTWGTPVRDVAIDIIPGSEENPVHPGAEGGLPVAVLSAPGFDALTVYPASVRLAGARVRTRPRGGFAARPADVNRDGRMDLLLSLDRAGLELVPGDTVAWLAGSAPGNLTVRGHDHVRVVGAKRKCAAAPLVAAGESPGLVSARALPSGRIAVEFAISPAAPARLELLDVAGRRIATATSAPGARATELGERLRPGLYWVRLNQGERSWTRRVVRLP